MNAQTYILQSPPPMNDQTVLHLPERQMQVWTLMSRGFTNREIGKALSITEKTAKSHVTALYQSLGVKHCRQAIMRFYTDPMVRLPSPPTSLPHGDSL